MFPSTMTVPAGTVLTFAVALQPRPAHGHDRARRPGDSGLVPRQPREHSISSAGPIDQQGVYRRTRGRRRPRPRLARQWLLEQRLHGHDDPTTLPKSSQVRIVAPGAYTFSCLLHPFMQSRSQRRNPRKVSLALTDPSRGACRRRTCSASGRPCPGRGPRRSTWACQPPTKRRSRTWAPDVNAFFPSTITIHKARRVRSVPTAFHSVDFPKKGDIPTPLAGPSGQRLPTTSTPPAIPTVQRPARPRVQPGARSAEPQLRQDRHVQRQGAPFGSSLPLGNKLKPMTVKFTKTGTFTYFCNVHAGMKAKVHVVAAKAKAPSAKADRRRSRSRSRRAAHRQAAPEPDGLRQQLQVGNSGRGGVEIFAFFPAARPSRSARR